MKNINQNQHRSELWGENNEFKPLKKALCSLMCIYCDLDQTSSWYIILPQYAVFGVPHLAQLEWRMNSLCYAEDMIPSVLEIDIREKICL